MGWIRLVFQWSNAVIEFYAQSLITRQSVQGWWRNLSAQRKPVTFSKRTNKFSHTKTSLEWDLNLGAEKQCDPKAGTLNHSATEASLCSEETTEVWQVN